MEDEMKKGITIRFDLRNPDDLQAWNCLHGIFYEQYKSRSKMVIAAINSKFGGVYGLAAAEGLEDTIASILQKHMPQAMADGFSTLLASAAKTQGDAPLKEVGRGKPRQRKTNDEDAAPSAAAMDFVNSF